LIFLLAEMLFSIRVKAEPIPFRNVHYRAMVDVLDKHLSGILLIRLQEDSSLRTVFLNETGTTFFDIAFYPDHYQYLHCIPGLDRKAVRRTLAKDLGMLICRSIYSSFSYNASGDLVGDLKRRGRVIYYLSKTDFHCDSILNLGRRKKVVTILPYFSDRKSEPDSVSIQHHTVHFSLQFKKMYVTE